MTDWLLILSWLPLLGGAFFFVAGTLGLLRFPDIYCRLHALTKADTLGLGLIVLGLSLRSESWHAVLTMVLVWLLVMASGATSCLLLARHGREQEIRVDNQIDNRIDNRIDRDSTDARH